MTIDRMPVAFAIRAMLVVAVLPSLLAAGVIAASANEGSTVPTVVSISQDGAVETNCGSQKGTLRPGQHLGRWTLMAVLTQGRERPLAVFEDFSQPKGHLLLVGQHGISLDLPKSLEPTWADPATLYHGHKLKEILESDRDRLAEEILTNPGDPDYAEVAACFPPIAKTKACYTFIGTHDNLDKVGIFYGGSTSHFDPAVYVPKIDKIRDEWRVLDGLVGGWLPAVRFVYPEQPGDWSELVAYAPLRVENGNSRIQPVWYRVCRIEGNTLKWARYFDTYHPFPPRTEQPASPFYDELLVMRAAWEQALGPAMKIDIPDQHLADLTRHCLVRAMITRMGSFPKYGVFDRSYGAAEHDGFPDTFTADTTAMLAWGLMDLARDYIDNYFTYFVRDDGSILYRGPETGQYGRMLTVVAEYASGTGDDALLVKHRKRIDAIARLLISLRQKALALPADDPAHGMIAGWSEADACLDPDPPRYMQPYFANTTEAARGFRDLGAVWIQIGHTKGQTELVAWGEQLRREAQAMDRDVQTAIERSILRNVTPVCLPAIAGVKEPFHEAVVRDKMDPQFRSYRAYMEMLYSGSLSREQVEMIVRYRAAHRDTILGIPACYGYNTHELAGFLSYGHAFGLIQHDRVREYLLALYSLMAHQYTRGTWTAPETRNIGPEGKASPYCVPAQVVVPLLTRWMLVLEDPASGTLWLAKGTPRSWLEDGKRIHVAGAPTKWGPMGFTLVSHLKEGNVEATVDLPEKPIAVPVKLRVRVPQGLRMQSVMVQGAAWSQFSPDEETVTLPAHKTGKITVMARYR